MDSRRPLPLPETMEDHLGPNNCWVAVANMGTLIEKRAFPILFRSFGIGSLAGISLGHSAFLDI